MSLVMCLAPRVFLRQQEVTQATPVRVMGQVLHVGDIDERGQRRVGVDVSGRLAQQVQQLAHDAGVSGEQRLCFLEGLLVIAA